MLSPAALATRAAREASTSPNATLRCPVFERCGGCPAIALSDEVRARLLCAEAEGALRAAGLVRPADVPPSFFPAPEPLAYRNRVRLAVGPGGVPRFFNPGKASDCAVLCPSVIEGIAALTARARVEPGLLEAFAHLELRARDELGRLGLRCTPRAGYEAAASRSRLAAATSSTRSVAAASTPCPAAAVSAPDAVVSACPPAPELGAEWLTGVSGEVDRPMPRQRWRVSDESYIEVPLDAFLQVNLAVNRALVAWVTAQAEASGARSFADLFMGAGNFSLPLLVRGLSGVGVERHAGAVAAAREVAAERGLTAELVAGDALSIAERWGTEGRRFDVVICDPPRAGLGARAPIAGRLARRSLALVSCRLASACADAARLVAEGFQLESVALFDMFPQTRHVEAVLWLNRR